MSKLDDWANDEGWDVGRRGALEKVRVILYAETRRLQRTARAARARIAELERQVVEGHDELVKFGDTIAALRAERDRLREALIRCGAEIQTWRPHMDMPESDFATDLLKDIVALLATHDNEQGE